MFDILLLFWYCFDDRLATLLNCPAVGQVPFGLWANLVAIWFSFIFFNSLIKARG